MKKRINSSPVKHRYKKLVGGRGIAIKRDDSNFHVWKQKINFILTCREDDHVISQPKTFKEGTPEYIK